MKYLCTPERSMHVYECVAYAHGFETTNNQYDRPVIAIMMSITIIIVIVVIMDAIMRLQRYKRSGGLEMQSSGLEMQSSGLEMQSGGLGMQSGGFEMQSGGLEMQSGGLGMQSGGLEMQSGGLERCSSRVAHSRFCRKKDISSKRNKLLKISSSENQDGIKPRIVCWW